ncbi:MAG TPA: BatD family protein [Bacteroidales bacterium]|nr:BatD family protein [Bacteroidales bacterium]
MMKSFAGLLAILLLWSVTIQAQDAVLKVSGSSQVEVGEQFRVVYELNAEGTNFTGPAFRGFRVLTGPMLSTSSSIQIIGGRVDRQTSQTYTYILSATQEGDFTIDPASVEVDGKTIRSGRLDVKVVPATNRQQRPASSTDNSSNTSGGLSSRDLFLRAIPDKRSAVIGEQVIITYRLYTRVALANIEFVRQSSFAGFWTKNLLESNNMPQSRQVIDGEEYVVADIRRVALFPQKAGKLTIEPMEISCLAQVRSRQARPGFDPFESFFNDPFFNRGIQNIPQTLVSEAITIDVSALPGTGRPSSFSGAVGQFGFSASLNNSEVKANEAINLIISVSGTGNLELLDLPKPIFPPGFEVFEPKLSADIKTDANGISGTRRAEYLVIPRFEGNFRIEPIEFSYFDPRRKEYLTLRSQPFEIRVDKGEATDAGGSVMFSSQEGIQYLSSDIRYINTSEGTLKPINSYLFGSWLYILLMALMATAFGASLYWHNKTRQLKQNQTLLRNRKATAVARKRLKAAKQTLSKGDQNAFYYEMSQALWGYISDKYTLPRSELSIDNVKNYLLTRNAPENLIDQFVDTLNLCEYARFAPGDTGKKMEDLYQKGIDVISKAENLIK